MGAEVWNMRRRAAIKPAVREAVAVEPASAEQLLTRGRRVRLIVEDLDSGEQAVLVDELPWRAIEILGSAGLHYAISYDNPDRPVAQIQLRREWAGRLGSALWDAAERRVGVQSPYDRDLPALTAR